jgi:RNA polymerase sigma-70 factor, ECF subfamily
MVQREVADDGGAGIGPPAAPMASFDEFYAANFHRLTLQLYAYTGDAGQAQDAVQEAFSRAWPRWSTLVTYDDPGGWVRRVAWNVLKNRWRRLRVARAHAHYHRERLVEGPSPDRVALARALATLPGTQRRAVILFYVADLPVHEIAAQEGVPEGTVKSWLHRGRTALAGLLNESRTEQADA